jgi:molybdopterin-guanine dinucleotide biosynthesis protein A
MNPTGKFSAVVLAGGRSSRMGREKALLECNFVGDRGPLWRRQREVLRAAGAAEVFLSAREEQTWRAAAEGFDGQLLDAIEVGGPIIGVTAGLERASHGHLAVLAVDLPRMSPAWFAALHGECGEGVGCVGRRKGDGEFFEPLAAIYPKALMLTAWEALVRSEFSLQRFVGVAVAEGRMRVREITADEDGLFENWNEPGDATR